MKNIKSTFVIIVTIIAGSLVGNVSMIYDIVFFSGLIFLLGVVTYFSKKAEEIVSATVEESSLEELNQCLTEAEKSSDLDEKAKNNLINEIKQKIELKESLIDRENKLWFFWENLIKRSPSLNSLSVISCLISSDNSNETALI